MSYQPPAPLGPANELSAFVCDCVEQPEWLVRHARQSMAMGTTQAFVLTPVDSDQVVASDAWTMAQIGAADAATRLREGAGSTPHPAAFLARSGVHRDHQGLGAALLREVIQRVAVISDDIGCRGLLVHSESEQARGFTRHLSPAFEPSPNDELHLVLEGHQEVAASQRHRAARDRNVVAGQCQACPRRSHGDRPHVSWLPPPCQSTHPQLGAAPRELAENRTMRGSIRSQRPRGVVLGGGGVRRRRR